MKVIPYSNDIKKYLVEDEIIDYSNCAIIKLADELYKMAADDLEYIKIVYEYMRDKIPHSSEVDKDSLPYVASDVLTQKHGVCFAKSHLFAALLRCKSIPAGFCYQKVVLNEDDPTVLAYHGLNGVYIESLDKWVRLDAGTGGQFSIQTEQLVFPIRSQKGEIDNFSVYPTPDKYIIDKLRMSKSRSLLMENLPTELSYC